MTRSLVVLFFFDNIEQFTPEHSFSQTKTPRDSSLKKVKRKAEEEVYVQLKNIFLDRFKSLVEINNDLSYERVMYKDPLLSMSIGNNVNIVKNEIFIPYKSIVLAGRYSSSSLESDSVITIDVTQLVRIIERGFLKNDYKGIFKFEYDKFVDGDLFDEPVKRLIDRSLLDRYHEGYYFKISYKDNMYLFKYLSAIFTNSPLFEDVGIIKALYLSVVTITTLGFGEIVPINDYGRILILIESILGIFFIGAFFFSLGLKYNKNQNKEVITRYVLRKK